MTTTPTRRTVVAAAAALLAVGGLAACSDADADSGAAGSDSADGFPMELASAYGSTELDARPETVAVVSDIDRDIALALGVVPVTGPKYGEIPLSEWTVDAAAELGVDELTSYDASDGTDFEALAAADPDVILATSGYSLEEDYEQLSAIAPVVAYRGTDGLSSMTWLDRTRDAATALGLSDEAEQVIADVEDQVAQVREANPEFEGVSYTYANVHPSQITYESYEGGDTSFFTDLGFVLPEQASQFSADDQALSKENIDQLEADVLFVGYPFGEEGLLGQDELESDRLFQSLDVVSGGHYGVIEDDLASPLTYKTPLTVPWVLENLTPVLQQTVAGS